MFVLRILSNISTTLGVDWRLSETWRLWNKDTLMDPDFLWHTLGGGAILAAALTLARLLLDYGFRGGERRVEQDDRRRAHQRDAEARLERMLQDRLAEADRRLERCDAELQSERSRSAILEHELLRTQQAFELLKVRYASLAQPDGSQRLPR